MNFDRFSWQKSDKASHTHCSMILGQFSHQFKVCFEQNDCTPPKCGELAEYTDSAHTEVEDPSSSENV